VKATFKDGILDVNLPKAEGLKPRRVHVDVK
jgi:HSP20 family molecular chaperone IbpA